MKTLSIIILSYNVNKQLLDCLASIHKHKDWEIIIPENGSTDGCAQIATIQNYTNPGFAAGHNVGISHSQGEFILLLNPDTIVYPKTIETVLEYMQDHLTLAQLPAGWNCRTVHSITPAIAIFPIR